MLRTGKSARLSRKQPSGQPPLDIHPDVDVVSAANSIGVDKPAVDSAHSRARIPGSIIGLVSLD